jgi:exodeoxyribonuclease V beta subunit
MSALFHDEAPLALGLPLRGSHLIEASAGTGKTFTISALYVRLVLGHGGEQGGLGTELLPPQILVMTFTDAATQELRDRIRTRLANAARFFREEIEAPDELIDRLRDDYSPDEWASCAGKLDIAAQWMDEAAVSTIHGWCQRMLREHAFQSGSLFTQTLETDHRDLLAEVVRDYWRHECYALDGAALDWVHEHWRTPDRLGRKLNGLLRYAVNAPAQATLAHLLADVLRAKNKALAAIKAPWMEWASELRVLCDDACMRKLVDGRKLKPSVYGPWLDRLTAWATDSLQHELELNKGFERLTPEGMADAWKAGDPFSHPALDAMRDLKSRLAQLPRPDSIALDHAAHWIKTRFEGEKRHRAEMGFDDMLDRLDAALRGPNAEGLAQLIRQQFPVALVDEFQDTDPVQYRIFDAIYQVHGNRQDCALLMIGDPKQAIYAFRGADIYTYLKARTATAGRHHTLDTNFRSSHGMVDAVNDLFAQAEERPSGQGAFLFRQDGHNPVPFHPVKAQGRKERFMVDGQAAVPLTFWHLEHPAPISNELYRSQCAAGCATEIVRLLELGKREQAGFQHPERGFSAVQPAHIAILVSDFAEAHAIRSALAQRGLRSVYLSDKDSVFDAAEARDLLLWLKACAEPDSDRLLRAALASRTLALPLSELERIDRDEGVWENWVMRLRGYRQIWQKQGVLPMLRRLLSDFDLPLSLVKRNDGERVLTNLLHLAEILQQAATELDGEQALIRHLAEHLDADGQTSEEQVLRLESDERLLKVVTIHKSKGLEYPLVFLPFISSFKPASKDRPPLRYHDARGELIVKTAPDGDDEQRADHERLAEDLRLLYVALTRARHACWLGVADLKRRTAESLFHRSALGYLVGGRLSLPASSELASWLDTACSGASMQVLPLPVASNEAWRAPAAAIRVPQLRRPSRSVSEHWWIASYSALRIAARTVDADGIETPAAVRNRTESGDTSPETAEAQKLFDDDVDVSSGERPGTAAASSAGGLHRFPRGPQPGTFLHGLLEWAGTEGFANVSGAKAAITDFVARRCNRRGWEAWIAPLSTWLAQLLNDKLPLGITGQSVSLASLGAYQIEMEFWFESRHVQASVLDELVRRHTLDAAPRPPAEPAHLNGMFKGFMDLVFEHQGRYYVADYKSNWLGVDDAAYTDEAMKNEVLAKRYDLQYVLYLLALHRQLRLRLPDYDYDSHMGGALYLFLRGSRSATQGLFFERPPRELIEELDELFSGMPVDLSQEFVE